MFLKLSCNDMSHIGSDCIFSLFSDAIFVFSQFQQFCNASKKKILHISFYNTDIFTAVFPKSVKFWETKLMTQSWMVLFDLVTGHVLTNVKKVLIVLVSFTQVSLCCEKCLNCFLEFQIKWWEWFFCCEPNRLRKNFNVEKHLTEQKPP